MNWKKSEYKVGPKTITVDWDCKTLPENDYGDYDINTCEIRLNTHLSADQKEVYFFHELIHALIQDSGHSFTQKTEEKICFALQSRMLAFLKDNNIIDNDIIDNDITH